MIDSASSPELELLNELAEIGVAFPSLHEALSVLDDWIRRHGLGDPDPQRRARHRQEVQALLNCILASKTATGAKQRAATIRHEYGLGPHKTARELAEEIGVSEGRMSQIRTETRNYLKSQVP